MTRGKWIIVGVVLVAIILVSALCVRRPVAVTTAQVQRGQVATTVAATGTVQADVAVKLGVKSVGTIRRINVKEDDRVAAGTVVAELDTHDQAQRDYERIRALYRKGAVSAQELENTRKRMEDTLVVSPINGTVTQKLVEQGETVAPGAPVAVVADLSTIVLRSEIYEADVGKVAVGQTANVIFDAYPGKTFAGTVKRIAPQSREAQKERGITFTVDIAFPPEVLAAETPLRIGMSGDVDVVAACKEDVVLTPQESIGEDETGGGGEGRTSDIQRFVYVVPQDRVLQKRPITTGLENDDFAEVVAGLNPGETVVTGDLSKIKPGMRVAPKANEQAK